MKSAILWVDSGLGGEKAHASSNWSSTTGGSVTDGVLLVPMEGREVQMVMVIHLFWYSVVVMQTGPVALRQELPVSAGG